MFCGQRWFIDIKVNLSVFFHHVVPVSLPNVTNLQLDHTQMNIFKIVLFLKSLILFLKPFDWNSLSFWIL